MRLPGQRRETEERESNNDPERISQRWVIILLAAAFGGVAVGVIADASALGIATALTLLGLLHAIMK